MNSTQMADTPLNLMRVFSFPWQILNTLIRAIAGLFGSKAKEVERFLKFAFVGVIGAIVDFGTLFILQATVLSPREPLVTLKVIAATTIAFLTAVTSNFIWNRYWTYPDSRSRSIRRQLAQFTFVNSIGWGMRTIWITLMYVPIGNALTPFFLQVMEQVSPEYVSTPDTPEKLGTFAAQFVALGFVMVWNFFANRYWTYNDVDAEKDV